MRRFFVGSGAVNMNRVTLTGSDAHHIKDVLRLRPGDKIVCIDESAAEHEVIIAELGGGAVIGDIVKTTKPELPLVELALFQGLPKGTKFDFVIEKATELGADRIAAVRMERTVPRADITEGKRTERWRRIAEAAAKQSRRATVPRVDGLLPFDEFVRELAQFDLAILFWESSKDPVEGALEGFDGKSVAVIIGPEGGLSIGEAEALLEAGAKPASLGPRILRTETAPIAALAIVNHLLGR